MNTIDPELEALYRQASKSEAPTRADREAVRAALGVAGVALATSTATVAAGAVTTMPLVTAGKVATWLSLGAILGTTSSVLVVVGTGQMTPSRASSVRASASVQARASRPPVPRQRREGATSAHKELVASPQSEAVPPLLDDATAPTVKAIPASAGSTNVSMREPSAAPAARPSMADVTPPSLAGASLSLAVPLLSSAPSLSAESRALELVQQALARGDSRHALALLTQQDSAFASGRLSEERAAARVLAWCALGQQGELERARARFVTNFPDSPLTKRVLNCGR
jgi:hypothetical protein